MRGVRHFDFPGALLCGLHIFRNQEMGCFMASSLSLSGVRACGTVDSMEIENAIARWRVDHGR